MNKNIRTLQRGRLLAGLSFAAVIGFGTLSGTAMPTVKQPGMEDRSAMQVVGTVPVFDAEQVVGAQSPLGVVLCVAVSVNPYFGWLLGPPCWKAVLN